MWLISQYPPLPTTLDINACHYLYARPDQAQWPGDFPFHIDATTGEKRTYQEFCERVRLGATALGAPISEGGLGLRGEDGEVVGIIGRNSSDYITLVHALLFIATPFAPVPIDANLTPFDLKQALRFMMPTRLFVETEFLPSLLPIAQEMGMAHQKIYILAGNAVGYRSFHGMIQEVQDLKMPIISPRSATKNTLAYLLLTSGTTGTPKTVITSHGNIVVAMQQRRVVLDFEIASGIRKQPDPLLTHLATLPLFHASGLNEYCFRPFLIPATYVILPQFSPELAIRAIPKFGINITIMWPPRIQHIVNHPLFKEVDLRSLQIVISTASPLPAEIARALTSATQHQIICFHVYGSTEAPSALYPQPHVRGSYGVLLPGMEARIVRDDGSDAAVNEVGELYLKGGSIACGYKNNEEAMKEMYVDGWLRTGDGFRADENNVLFFSGRVRDIIQLSSFPFQRIDPTEIESILLGEPQKLITDVCVAGVSGRSSRDRAFPRAWVILSPAGRKMETDAAVVALLTWSQKAGKEYWLTGGVEIVEKLPRTHSGKIYRRLLQDEYEHRVAGNYAGKL